AVLVVLTKEASPRVILGRRALHLKLHPGEIAFPGGKREPEDISPWDTALREAEEEIGWPQAAVQPLGELAALVTRSGFMVHPCVVSVATPPPLQMDPAEFDTVFMAPLSVFAEHARYRIERMHDGVREQFVPHYELDNGTVWGVTARVLVQLANIGLLAGLDLPQHKEHAT
ncbi:MAG TPA: CoA pyrophosphatase, partial [Kineobactrum sp.]